MSTKNTLIATFVLKTKILTSLEYLKNDIGLNLDDVFVYTISNNEKEYLLTFNDKNNIPYDNLTKITKIHVKNGCLFSINALNALIEQLKSDYKTLNQDYIIDWSKMKDKLLLISNNTLKIENLVKINNKCDFFV